MITAIIVLSIALSFVGFRTVMTALIMRLQDENRKMHLIRLEQRVQDITTAMRLYMALPEEANIQRQVLTSLEALQEDLACMHDRERAKTRLNRTFQNIEVEVRRVSIPIVNNNGGRITPAHSASKRKKA